MSAFSCRCEEWRHLIEDKVRHCGCALATHGADALIHSGVDGRQSGKVLVLDALAHPDTQDTGLEDLAQLTHQGRIKGLCIKEVLEVLEGQLVTIRDGRTVAQDDLENLIF